MAIYATTGYAGIASSNPVELEYATDRMRAEHEELRNTLKMMGAGVQEMSKEILPLTGKKQLSEAAGHLVQACLILNDHLTMEEQLVFPVAEKVLTDLESFFF